jgi:hypothetical protein
MMDVLMSLATGSESDLFYICSHSAQRVKERWGCRKYRKPRFAPTLALLRTTGIRLMEAQAMQAIPTLRLQRTFCEKDKRWFHGPPTSN